MKKKNIRFTGVNTVGVGPFSPSLFHCVFADQTEKENFYQKLSSTIKDLKDIELKNK